MSLNDDEGYTDEGFKIKSRDLLEADLGDKIIQNKETTEYENEDANVISNITKAMGIFIGIDIEPFMEFIVRNVIIMQSKIMPSKEKFDKAIEVARSKGKKNIETYENSFNQSLIILTLSYLLIAIQTSIPSIQTRKKHPGCIKSFTGFPLNGDEDKTGLTYLACITIKIKSNIPPWNSLKKINEPTLIKKIEQTINKFIINNSEVKEKILEKVEYDKLNPSNTVIPQSLNIQNWQNFLPPLTPINVSSVPTITETFRNEFINKLKTGTSGQNDDILMLRSKLIFFALKIEEIIESIIKTKSSILSNNAGEPFLENSCCDEDNINTLEYFTSINKEIDIYNTRAKDIHNLLIDIGNMTKASILFDNRDTKEKFPSIPKDFSEETIYRAFIFFCNYNSYFPIKPSLRIICIDKPSNFNINDDITRKIELLKREGITYTRESLDQLMSIINKENIVHFPIFNITIHTNQILNDILTNINSKTYMPDEFKKQFINLINKYYDNNLKEDNEEIRDFKNYLYEQNNQLKEKITDFLRKFASKSLSKKILDCFNNIVEFEKNKNSTIESDDQYIFLMSNFIKNTLRNISKVFPYIILNQVSYKNFRCPKHWKISDRHQSDIRDFVNKYYVKLYPFFDDLQIDLILNNIYLKDISDLADETYFIAPIKDGTTYYYNILDRRMMVLLFQYYFYLTIFNFIQITDNPDVINMDVLRPSDITADEVLIPSIGIIDVEEKTGIVDDIEILSGEKEKVNTKIANLISNILDIICNEKELLNINYNTLKKKLNKSKEKEKSIITDYLRDLTDEEREIENLFKNQKLEKWSKGQQKGVRIYDKNTYDQEREDMDAQAIKDSKLMGLKDVNESNRNIYQMDMDLEQRVDDEIEHETNDLTYLFADEGGDVPDDMDGDELY